MRTRRLLVPFVQVRDGESTTAVLMFAYSFLAMTAYNIIKPVTRSKFIADLGADNLPWVQLGAGVLIGLIMHGYARAIGRVPRRWAIPVTQAGLVVLLVAFWVLLSAGYEAASAGFYVLGLILGLLLISQFWTLANDIYDARHAKRLFGFIGGGASLGGAMGAAITAMVVARVGTVNLLLVSAAVMLVCLALVVAIVRREERAGGSGAAADTEGVGATQALQLLRQSRHLQLIAVIIGCASMGGAIVEQQLNMAAAASLGQDTDGITRFLAQVTVYLSLIGFLIQVGLTSRIHRLLGIGFALLILPAGLGATAVVMLANGSLWAPAVARVLDSSLRYTVDKTTREILFLPLPAALKYRAKPFVDVTTDRFAKALGALLVLILIKPWGFGASWQQLSIASLALTALWVVLAARAKREYLATFRRSIARHDVEARDIRAPHADLQTIELLVEELAHPDEQRVLYAIDLLESLDKRHLITPLLLRHTSAAVRARTLRALEVLKPDVAARYLPTVESMLADEDAEVRAAAVHAVAAIRGEAAADLVRPYLHETDPRVVTTAAVALAASGRAADIDAADAALHRLVADTRESAAPARREAVRAIGRIAGERFHHLLVPLLFDRNVEVAREAIRSVGRLGPTCFLFIAPLVTLLRHRLLKNDARAVLVGYGEAAVEPLAHFLHDAHEDIWVRRHLPATMAQLPCQRTLDALIDALSDRDGFLRYKVIAAIEAVHHHRPELVLRREPIEALALAESFRYFNALILEASLVREIDGTDSPLVVRALTEKQRRSRERIFRLLGLLYTHADIGTASMALERGDARRRAGASEYLDNILTGPLRARILLMVEDMPADERVRRAHVLFRTRYREIDDTLAQLVHDEDDVIAATAIHLVAERDLRSLADDLQYIVDHRDGDRSYAVDAASWALDGAVPLPAVEIANRLRRIPMFDYVSVDELFRIAGMARQNRYDRGRLLFAAGTVPDTLQFLVAGEVHEDGASRSAPAVVGFDGMLAGTPMRADVRVSDHAVALSLTESEFFTLLSDNVEIARGLFRMLLDADGGPGADILHGTLPEPIARRATASLQPTDALLLLQSTSLFAAATTAQLVRLAGIAQEVALVPGAAMVREGDEAVVHIVVSGALLIERRGQSPLAAGPGDIVGLYDTLADGRAAARVTASASGTALRLASGDLFDILAGDVDLLQRLFSAFVGTETVYKVQSARFGGGSLV